MADWEVTVTRPTDRRGEVETKSVIVQQCVKKQQAEFLGLEEILGWAKETNASYGTAYDWWMSTGRRMAQPYEMYSELENQWQLKLECKEIGADILPAPAVPAKARILPPPPNGTATPKFDLRALLTEQLATLTARQKDIQAELKENAENINGIRAFLMASAVRKTRTRRAKSSRSVSSEAYEAEGGADSGADV